MGTSRNGEKRDCRAKVGVSNQLPHGLHERQSGWAVAGEPHKLLLADGRRDAASSAG